LVAIALGSSPAAVAQDCAGDCTGDLDGSGTVDGADLAVLLGAWGPCPGCVADLNGSGAVDAADLAVLLGQWNGTCTTLDWATVLEFAPDPAVVTDANLRNAIIATGLAWRVRDNASQIEMLLVPPGTFQMGCSPSDQWGCDFNESPVHTVTLTCPFYIGRYEVTQAQWQAKMGSNPSFFVAANGYPGSNDRPVETVSWTTIQGFLSATGLRLPTEAEWEYAYRAGTTTAFHSGPGFPNGTNNDLILGNIAWYGDNSGNQTHFVGGKAANALGLHDMSGNVWEWVNDWYSSTYYASSPAVNPPGPASGPGRVLRGGSWGSGSFNLRSSDRVYATPGGTFISYGFRVARAP
jgi:formylglycine-generating enzyme required for sulfatase activity